tara:strand:+ start:145 stop:918 length:774 start_codon:yes stop_codon:yes gene_type:complete
MTKNCLIWQASGLGDILFTLKIGAHYANHGYRVIWPVAAPYENLNDYIQVEGVEFFNQENSFPYKENYSNFNMFRMTEIIETPDLTYVPLSQAFHSMAAKKILPSEGHEASNMLGKYAMCGLEYSDWADYFSLKRDTAKEERLYNLLERPEHIHLINKVFGTPPQWDISLTKEILGLPEFTQVNMRTIEDFCIFDWAGIIEKAEKIDTVATATAFLFEKIDLNCVPTIHSRNKTLGAAQGDFKLMQKLYSKVYDYEP